MSSSAPNGSSEPTTNGSARPNPYARARTSEEDVQRRTNEDNRRVSLGRNLSTSILESDGQPPVGNPTSSVEFTLGQSWSNGFGEITDVTPFGQSWTAGTTWTGFENLPRRVSTGTTVERNFPPPLHHLPHRALTEGAVPPHPGISNNHTGVSSAMHDAARLKDWQRVRDICERDPASAAYVGPGGYTALHHLCDKRCPHADVAEAVIQAHPDALTVESVKGWTPLHLACRFKCKGDVVRALLNLHPENGRKTVSKPDRQRRTPLYYAVRYDSPPGVVPQLLEVDPSVVLADGSLESPLAVFWDAFAEKLDGKRALHPYIGDQNGTTSPEVLRQRLFSQPDSELLKNWRRANMFLKAAFGFPLTEDEEVNDAKDRRWRILHATAAVKCHITLFQMACALYPEQAAELDENDLYHEITESGGNDRRKQTALHLAASSNASGDMGHTIISALLRLYPDAANIADEIDGSYPLHRIAENKHKVHWTVDGLNPLYMMNPSAVEKPDRRGKLPLHRAAAAISHQEDTADIATRSIICNLLEVFPRGASVRDEDGCLPLHLIAANGEGWNEEVQAVFEAHQGAVSVRTGRRLNSSLPLHFAAANPNATKSMIDRLVEHNPRGASQVDGQGKLPLHLACELGKNWEEDGTETIFNAFPQAIRIREENERQWMALHMASASKADCGDLVEKLVELHPEACVVADSKGRLPFHLACASGKNWKGGLSALFEGNPTAISAVDNLGRIPLYIVAGQYSRASGQGAIGDRDSNDQPLSLSRNADELDVLFNLVRSDPTTIPESP